MLAIMVYSSRPVIYTEDRITLYSLIIIEFSDFILYNGNQNRIVGYLIEHTGHVTSNSC
jgi:hypothetical protein